MKLKNAIKGVACTGALILRLSNSASKFNFQTDYASLSLLCGDSFPITAPVTWSLLLAS